MRLRSELMIAVQQAVTRAALTEVEAAKQLGVTRPWLNDRVRGRIGEFTVDDLILLATRPA